MTSPVSRQNPLRILFDVLKLFAILALFFTLFPRLQNLTLYLFPTHERNLNLAIRQFVWNSRLPGFLDISFDYPNQDRYSLQPNPIWFRVQFNTWSKPLYADGFKYCDAISCRIGWMHLSPEYFSSPHFKDIKYFPFDVNRDLAILSPGFANHLYHDYVIGLAQNPYTPPTTIIDIANNRYTSYSQELMETLLANPVIKADSKLTLLVESEMNRRFK